MRIQLWKARGSVKTTDPLSKHIATILNLVSESQEALWLLSYGGNAVVYRVSQYQLNRELNFGGPYLANRNSYGKREWTIVISGFNSIRDAREEIAVCFEVGFVSS